MKKLIITIGFLTTSLLSHATIVHLYLNCLIQSYSHNNGTMTEAAYNRGCSSDQNLSETILVELHSKNYPYALVATGSSELSNIYTGTVDLISAAEAFCWFDIPSSDDYYIVVKPLNNQNFIETWSKYPVYFNTSTPINPVEYNFTTDANKAFDDNQIEVYPGFWAFYSGDVNHDENIDLTDYSYIEEDVTAGAYYASCIVTGGPNVTNQYTDTNGDANVDLLDLATVELNVLNFIYSHHP